MSYVRHYPCPRKLEDLQGETGRIEMVLASVKNTQLQRGIAWNHSISNVVVTSFPFSMVAMHEEHSLLLPFSGFSLTFHP